MTTIYLSSTYEDLAEHRRVVYDALRKSGYDVIAMEEYVAADERPLEACLKDIAERADIYVGIYAFRYGYIPPEEHVRDCQYTVGHEDWLGLSITELEYCYAEEEANLPCLTFVVKEGISWPMKFIDAYSERNDENPGKRIDRLREHLLTERLASQFTSPHELASLVQSAVTKLLKNSEGHVAQRKPSQPEITWDIDKDGSPYPGLMHFTRKYAPVFFGREYEVNELLERISTGENRFILVSGDSGVGKSSVVDAGLLPRLEETGFPAGRDCLCVRMVPSQGNHPFDSLMRTLHVYAEKTELDSYAVGEELCENPGGLSQHLEKITSKGAGGSELVLFLDQMEECFTSQALEYADVFLSALYQAAQEDEKLWVIATIRSDFLKHCHRYPDLLSVLNSPGHYAIGQINPVFTADMIKKPAQCAGLEISDRLVGRIAKDAGSESGSLPLLAFVMQRLFEERVGRELSEKVYEGFNGVDGAVADHVKTVEQELRNEFGTEIDVLFPELFRALLVVDAEGLPTRRRALLSGFTDELGLTVDRLIKTRLLTTEGEGEDSTVSVAHENLFKTWPALALWIAENQDDLRVLRQAEIESREWVLHKYDLAYLWHLDRLKRLQNITQRFDSPDLKDAIRRFTYPQDTLLEVLKRTNLTHQERLSIGEYLSELGDPRPGVGLGEGGLPEIKWCPVGGGEITLGDNAGKFRVEPFFIAKYPVTWMQYRSFVEAEDGYHNEDWWIGLARQDSRPEEQDRVFDNYPATKVSWYEAAAFCRWLTSRIGNDVVVRLPTEWEWQQAATRGNPDNIYPWGSLWDSSRVNTLESDVKRITVVGMYPQGADPEWALDMSGNVGEWCLNEYDEPKQVTKTGKKHRSLRGGSFALNRFNARCSYRGGSSPELRFNDRGFRVCSSSPIL
jgi:Novel STAND NTPase 1/Sulfatase-modifying factor enzyme 1/Domain of unknown function (DUF4062)